MDNRLVFPHGARKAASVFRIVVQERCIADPRSLHLHASPDLHAKIAQHSDSTVTRNVSFHRT